MIEYQGNTGKWFIEYNPKPIPIRTCDYDYWHEDYDGAEDSNDYRSGNAASVEACTEEIVQMELEELDENYWMCFVCQLGFLWSDMTMDNGKLVCNKCSK